jgi:hypothetical protein
LALNHYLIRNDRGAGIAELQTGIGTLLSHAETRRWSRRDKLPNRRRTTDIIHNIWQQEQGQQVVCALPAHNAFLAPINPDSLEAVLLRP